MLLHDPLGVHPSNSCKSFKGATRLGATGPATLRKMALWEGLWKTSWNLWKTSENLWKPLKTSEKPLKSSENLWKASLSAQRPSQRQISLSEPLRPVAPIPVAPQTLSETGKPWCLLRRWRHSLARFRREVHRNRVLACRQQSKPNGRTRAPPGKQQVDLLLNGEQKRGERKGNKGKNKVD